MKARPFKATPVPSTEGKGPDDTISQAQLVALIASRAPRDAADDDATVRNRMLAMVSRDVKLGKLVRGQNGFRLGDVAFWAALRWPGQYGDLPKDNSVGYAEFELLALGVSATIRQLPGNIEDAHREIIRLHDAVEALHRKLEAERAKVGGLEPDATKWREWMAKKRVRRTS